jgi:hypothetical protein
MVKLRIVRSSYNENLQKESYIFLQRLIEKALLDELKLSPVQKGVLIERSNKEEGFNLIVDR